MPSNNNNYYHDEVGWLVVREHDGGELQLLD